MENLISWIQPAIIIALILFVWRDTNRKIEKLDDKMDCLSGKIGDVAERVAKIEAIIPMLSPMGRAFGMATRKPPDQDKDQEEIDNEEAE